MNVDNPATLSAAVVAWSGWRHSRRPVREQARVVAEFGDEVASPLMVRIREVEDEFYASDARSTARDVTAMSEIATSDFRKNSELSDEAVRALAWCDTYDYK